MDIKTTTEYFAPELQEFSNSLANEGVAGALRYLNQRTPHRYTGIFRYDGEILENIAIYDKYDLNFKKGDDSPLVDTYCSLLVKEKALEITDAVEDERVKGVVITPVVSYCGVLLQDSDGNPIGSLCHYDLKRCQERSTDLPLLEAAAEMLHSYLFPKS